jgi:hypothetical protein
VAAQHAQTWVTFGPLQPEPTAEEWHAGVAAQLHQFADACTGLGRDPSTVRKAVLVGLELGWAQETVDAWDDFCGRVESLGCTDVIVHWPRPDDAHLPGVHPIVFDEISRRLSGSS